MLAVVVALIALDAWWVATYRHGYPFDVDEAGYTSFALVDYFGLHYGGLHGWWEAVQTQGAPNAPLVTALTAFVLAVKPGVLAGFGTLAAFLALLAAASYGIGERLAGPRLGAMSAVVVAASPGAFTYLHEFIFALPAAALLASAVYALLRSDGLQRSGWSIACGAAIGLMLLARTMTVAFVPGLVVAGVVTLLARRREWRRGLLNLVLLGLSAVAVAATWYWRNLRSVVDYLTNFGYGSHSSEFGSRHSPISWDWWKAVTTRMVTSDLLVPLALLVLAGLICLGYIAVRRVFEASDRRRAVIALAGTDAFAVATVFAAGYVALSSSRNAGNGFTFPIAVLLPPLAVLCLRHYRRALVPATAVALAVTVLNVLSTSTIWEGLSRQRTVSIPAFGALPWLHGAPNAVGAIRVQVPGPETRFDERDRGWTRADRELARFIVEDLGTPTATPLVAFASRNRAISTNTVQLAALQIYQRTIPLTQLVADDGNTAAVYARTLSDPAFGLPTVVVTTDRSTGDFEPTVNQAAVEAALRRLHFRRVRTMLLPDGRHLRVWQKVRGASRG